jgi:hypothetical protein
MGRIATTVAPLAGVQLQPAAGVFGSLPHCEDADAFSSLNHAVLPRFRRGAAVTVVADLEPGLALLPPELDDRARASGTLPRVLDRLLGNAEKGALDVWVHAAEVPRQDQLDRPSPSCHTASAYCEVCHQPIYRAAEVQRVRERPYRRIASSVVAETRRRISAAVARRRRDAAAGGRYEVLRHAFVQGARFRPPSRERVGGERRSW